MQCPQRIKNMKVIENQRKPLLKLNIAIINLLNEKTMPLLHVDLFTVLHALMFIALICNKVY
jgi:hypothetical protein